ncbi:hydroxymethylbilane synthase [Pseudacidobacterium ailaaui]|jgi:hydroxymethylbilane synthase|uniref:hydroxymethylbilane synthase n=1 Tax=Pseudacidobacterium ailaaui TaxID=1382359 RepID=UPI00047E468B|nr:hydroxymethylbilane synthase [Pseudacidobacterium ailaaui]MBX6361367.1 hydroxymethylbilane synthase [Pseudacidobacterium ailaaui]MDI3255734.1 hydroxymethylbilane synthase [Bacillota bacterium]
MVRIGSRGSQLALWQANYIAEKLREAGHDVSIEIIRTTGDARQNVAFPAVGTKGMFTKEIEEALREHRIDLAVHSLKDLPTELDPAFTIAAIPQREDARDAFVSIQYKSFAALPPGARIGTSSLRRQAQLRAIRRDVEIVEFRGNVDTRLRKLQDGQVDAIVVAVAGLERLQCTEWIQERFSPLDLCPAPGQGALAIETCSEDMQTRSLLAFLEDEQTRYAVTVERTALGLLGGGCHVPIGVYCRNTQQGVVVTGTVAHPEGSPMVRVELDLQSAMSAQQLGQLMAERLLEQGARKILGAVQL